MNFALTVRNPKFHFIHSIIPCYKSKLNAKLLPKLECFTSTLYRLKVVILDFRCRKSEI